MSTTEPLWVDYSYARPDVTPYVGVMRYLNISPTGGKGLTPAEVADLKAKGKPIGLIWETDGRTDKDGTTLARDHVARANAEADRLGAPKDVAIFYAVDFDTAAPEQFEPYVVALLAEPGRPVGLYGEADVTQRARELGVQWTWQTLAWSKGEVDLDANLYQRDFQTGYDVSLERHVFPAWGRPLPTPPAPEEPPVTTVKKPPCVRVLWRGVVVCSHTVPKLDAWAKSVGAGIYLKPLAGCGSYQTSTAASAGTHAGGGAIDIDLRYVASTSRKWVADKGRTSGLQVSWHRNAISGLWTWHAHALDPDCPQLATVAAAQCVECFNGGDGLVGTTPDGNTRTNITTLKSIFNNRAVVQIADTVYRVGSAVVLDAKVKGIQHALRQIVDGKLGQQTYDAVWRLSRASREGRAGFYKLTVTQRKALQKDIGCKFVDGSWIAAGSEMPQRIRDAVGGVQRAMGIPIDRVWTDDVEGRAFAALMAAAGFKP